MNSNFSVSRSQEAREQDPFLALVGPEVTDMIGECIDKNGFTSFVQPTTLEAAKHACAFALFERRACENHTELTRDDVNITFYDSLREQIRAEELKDD